MQHKIINFEGKDWVWPIGDERGVFCFETVEELPRYLKHVKKFDVCVQAGGLGGLYADYLADHFGIVYCYEPAEHYEYCVLNITKKNVILRNKALDDHQGMVDMVDPLPGNYGAMYTKPGNKIKCVKLDDEDIGPVDFLMLDIEGAEYPALHGAQELIRKYHPVIAIEDKPLNQGRRGSPTEYLKREFKYQVVERVRWDNILC